MEGKCVLFLAAAIGTLQAQLCFDRLPNCNTYMAYSCRAPYINWALNNCKRTCNLCSYTPPGTGTSCQDKSFNCADFMYNDSTFCRGMYRGFAASNCARSCNLCSERSNQMVNPPPMMSMSKEVVEVLIDAETCEDALEKCNSYPDSSCESPEWSVTNCKKRCNLCSKTPQTCEDKAPHCHAVLCSGYVEDWARQYCPVTCNFCNESTTPAMSSPTKAPITILKSPTPPPTIKAPVRVSKPTAASPATQIPAVTLVPRSNWDMKTRFPRRTLLPPMCGNLRGDCYSIPDSKCLDYMWAIPNCKQRCNICGNVSETCEDKTDCSRFGSGLRCDGYFRYWARQYCPVKCGYCRKSKPAMLERSMAMDPNQICTHDGKTYQRGESWVEDCKWRWTCGENVGKGICWDWGFTDSSSCYMKPPKPGKCCPTPVCPSNVKLMYPNGYKEE